MMSVEKWMRRSVSDIDVPSPESISNQYIVL